MKIRIKFSKRGVIKYIGHLDLMRYFQKALRRTDIVVMYSKGFSPHMIMSFAQPLGVGVESDGEYFDLEIADDYDYTTVTEKLNRAMAEGVTILDTIKLPDNAENAMASVQAADYEINFSEEVSLPSNIVDEFNKAESVLYTKTTKSGEHEINVKEFVYDIKLVNDKCIFFKVNASSSGNLKPTVLLESLFTNAGLDVAAYPYHILRKEVYCNASEGKLIPLGEVK